MISTPVALATHLHENRQTAVDLVQAVVEDLQGATDAIMEVLDQGYDRTTGAMEFLGWPGTYQDFIEQPMIEAGTDWFEPLSQGDYWDVTKDLLSDIGVAEDLADTFSFCLVLECPKLTEEKGKATSESAIIEIFGTKALEALDVIREDEEAFERYALYAEAAPHIVEWMGEAITAKGEVLTLYAVIRLISEEAG